MNKIALIILILIVISPVAAISQTASVPNKYEVWEPEGIIHKEIYKGNLEGVKALLKKNPEMMEAIDSDKTPLQYAIRTGKRDIIEYLVQNGADVNRKTSVYNPKGEIPLHMAVRMDEYDVASLLLSNGAEPNNADKDGETPLSYSKNLKMTELLVKNGAKVDIKDNYGNTLLHSITDTKTLEYLIALGLDVNAQNNDGNTPLHYAANVDNAKLLLKNGAKIDTKNNRGETPIFCKDAETTEFLISKGANVNDRDQYGQTPLHAATYRDEKTIEVLIAHGAMRNAKDNQGNTPMRLMLERCHICGEKSYRALLSHSADISFRELIELLIKGRFYSIVYLVKFGSKIPIFAATFLVLIITIFVTLYVRASRKLKEQEEKRQVV